MKGNSILSMTEKNDAGKRYIKGILHEIYDTEDKWNKNGITWLEEYTKKNMKSAIGMPLCCQFLDCNNDVPYGHGYADVKDGKIIYEDSVVVGSVTNVFIDTVDVIDANGVEKTVKALLYEGYIYEQRYPLFVRWLIENIYDKKPIATSVEIMADKNHDSIIYRDGYKKEGRIPMDYAYSGHAILSIEPADDSSVIIELNSFKNNNMKEDNNMANTDKNDTILELNNKIENKIKEIGELNNKISKNQKTIEELNNKIKDQETTIKSHQEKEENLTKEIKELNDNLKQANDKLNGQEIELNRLKKLEKKVEDEKLINELNSKLADYSEDERNSLKDKIEKFNKEPNKEMINTIISEINEVIAKKVIEDRKKTLVENNSLSKEDVYSDIESTKESNSIDFMDLY